MARGHAPLSGGVRFEPNLILREIDGYRRPDLDRVHPLKPDNAGGGKGPQFKTGAIRSEGPGDWATYQLR
jgi:hypothetical protein